MADEDKTPTKPPKPGPTRTIEDHAVHLKLEDWQFAGVKTLRHWPEGKEVSENDFKDALKALMNTEIR